MTQPPTDFLGVLAAADLAQALPLEELEDPVHPVKEILADLELVMAVAVAGVPVVPVDLLVFCLPIGVETVALVLPPLLGGHLRLTRAVAVAVGQAPPKEAAAVEGVAAAVQAPMVEQPPVEP